MKPHFIISILLLEILVLTGISAQAQVLKYEHHGDKATAWSLPSTLDGSQGIEQFPGTGINFMTQFATRFSPSAGDLLEGFHFYLDGIVSGAADFDVSYAGPQAAFAWPIPFNHVPQTFLKQAVRFTSPEASRLSSVDLFTGSGLSSSDGFNDIVKLSFLRPFVPTTTTVKYGNENPQNNPSWEFNFPVGTSRSAYGTRFTIPAASRVNEIEFWVNNMNHNTFLPAGDSTPNDSLIVKLWTSDENGLPQTQIAQTKVDIGTLQITAWNRVSFFAANITTETEQDLIATFELEAVGLQDHIGFSSGSALATVPGRSILRENGNWVKIKDSASFGSGAAGGVELWIRALVIPASGLENDPLTPNDNAPLTEAVEIPLSNFVANEYYTVDLRAKNIQMTAGQDVWVVVELIPVGQPDTFSFISDGAEQQPLFRAAAYISDSVSGTSWKYMQNTQFNNEYSVRMRATFSVEDDTEVKDNVLLIMYSDDNGKPGNFLNIAQFPLSSLTVGEFNRISLSPWNYISNGSDIHLAITAEFDANQFSLATDDGSNALGQNRSSAYFLADAEWKNLADIDEIAEVNFLMKLEYRSTVSVEDADESVAKFHLEGNYPNPFNPTTTVVFETAVASHVQLHVYDMLGRRVATLSDGMLPQGQHRVNFDATALSSGTYLLRLTSEGQSMTRKMMLLK